MLKAEESKTLTLYAGIVLGPNTALTKTGTIYPPPLRPRSSGDPTGPVVTEAQIRHPVLRRLACHHRLLYESIKTTVRRRNDVQGVLDMYGRGMPAEEGAV